MKKPNTVWRLWAKSIGEKASKCNKESDKIAIIRSLIFLTYLITNTFIIASVVKHWNDNQPIEIYIDNAVPSNLQQTKEKKLLKTNSNFPYD